MTIPCGPCAEFCIYHLMNIGAGEEGLRPDNGQTQNGDNGNPLFTSRKLSIGKKQPLSTPRDTSATALSNGTSSTVNGKGPSKAAKVQPNPASQHFLPPDVLGQVASVLRSKNAGPFEVTFDVMFASDEEYRLIKESGVLSASTAAEILGLPEEEIVWCGFFDSARAFKVTIPRKMGERRVPSGSYMEEDVHAAQQYLPLMYMKLPQDLLDKLAAAR